MDNVMELDDFIKAHEGVYDTENKYLSEPSVRLENESVFLGDYSLGTSLVQDLCSKVELPVRLVNSVPKDLLVHNLNYMLKRKSDNSFSLEVNKENKLVSLTPFVDRKSFSDTFRPIAKGISSEHVALTSTVDVTDSHVYFVTENNNTSPAVNDVVSGGLYFNHNRQEGKSEASIYTHRLLCTNGMVAVQNEHSWKQRRLTFSDFINMVNTTYGDYCGSVFDSINRLTNIPFDSKSDKNINRVIKSLVYTYYISSRLSGGLKGVIEDNRENISTAYDLWNVITSEATHGDYSDNDRHNLLKFGGNVAEVLSMGSISCGSCGSRVV